MQDEVKKHVSDSGDDDKIGESDEPLDIDAERAGVGLDNDEGGIQELHTAEDLNDNARSGEE